MVDTVKSETVRALAEFIEEHQGDGTIALDISEQSSWTDFFVITTVRSKTHMRGLVRYVKEFLQQRDISEMRRHKKISDDGWMLIDCGDVVIHLMEQDVREFYELERLWFAGKVIYQSSKSS